MRKAFRFVHAADLHLDSPFRGLVGLPEAIQREVRESTFQALEQLVALALREQVDFMVIAGDLFDSADRSLRAQLRFHRAAQRLADEGIQMFIVHGNHDPEAGYRASLQWPAHVYHFGSDQVERRSIYHRDGTHLADIYGISYKFAQEKDNFAAQFEVVDPSCFNIALLHSNVDGRPGHDHYAPASKQELIRSGFHYWALGHIHTREVLHTDPWIVYPGNLQGRSVRESGPRGAMLVEVKAKNEVDLTFHALDVIRWQRRHIDISPLADEQALLFKLRQALQRAGESAEGRSTLVRIVLEGGGPLHDVLANAEHVSDLLELLQEEAEMRWLRGNTDAFIWPEQLEIRTSGNWDISSLLKEDSFLGDMTRLAQFFYDHPAALQSFAKEAFSLGLHSLSLDEVTDEQLSIWMKQAEDMALRLLSEGGRAHEN